MGKVLPYVPSFLERLQPGLEGIAGGAGSILGGHLAKRAAQTKKEGKEKEFDAFFSKYMPQNASQESGSSGTPGTPMDSTINQTQGNQPDFSSMTPLELVRGADLLEKTKGKNAANIFVKQVETQQKQGREKQKELEQKVTYQNNLQNIVGEYSELLGKPGIGVSMRTRPEERKNAGIFSGLKPRLINLLRDLETKGQLSLTLYKDLTSQLPEVGDRPETAQGKLIGFAKSMGEHGFPIDITDLESKTFSVFGKETERKQPERKQTERPPLSSFIK